MKKKSNDTTFLFSIQFYFLLIVIGVLYSLSSFLYLVKNNRIEQQVLYYYSYAQGGEEFVPEMRNIPRSSKRKITIRSVLFNTIDLVRFIDELMLGPQNIYAQPLASKYFKLTHIYFAEDNNIYIELMQKNESLGDMSQEELIEKVQKWFNMNILGYFPSSKAHLIFK